MTKVKIERKIKLIKSEQLETIIFSLFYPVEIDDDLINYISIIKQMVLTSNEYCETNEEFITEMNRNLIINYDIDFLRYGKTTFFRFDLEVPKEGLITTFNLDRAFKFFVDTINKPLVDDEGFKESRFIREKEFLIKKAEHNNNNIYNYANGQFFKYFDVDNYFNGILEEKINKLRQVDRKKAYEIYQKNIINNNFIPFVMGNISEERVEELFGAYLPIKAKYLEYNQEYYKSVNFNKLKYYEEEGDYNQSALFINLTVDNMSEDDFDYLDILSRILAGKEINLLLKKVRTEANLVYAIYLYDYIYNGFLTIETYIDEKNKSEAITLIENILKSLENKKLIKEYIEKIKKAVKIALIKQSDSFYYPLTKEINKTFHLYYTEDFYHKINKFNVDKFIQFLKRLRITNTYFMKGIKND